MKQVELSILFVKQHFWLCRVSHMKLWQVDLWMSFLSLYRTIWHVYKMNWGSNGLNLPWFKPLYHIHGKMCSMLFLLCVSYQYDLVSMCLHDFIFSSISFLFASCVCLFEFLLFDMKHTYWTIVNIKQKMCK